MTHKRPGRTARRRRQQAAQERARNSGALVQPSEADGSATPTRAPVGNFTPTLEG